MGKPKLPIDDMDNESFREFKKEYLDKEVLDDESLGEIEKALLVGDPSTGTVACAEYHGHDYKCVVYDHPATGIVHRLVIEIKRYQERLSKIKHDVEQG